MAHAGLGCLGPWLGGFGSACERNSSGASWVGNGFGLGGPWAWLYCGPQKCFGGAGAGLAFGQTGVALHGGLGGLIGPSLVLRNLRHGKWGKMALSWGTAGMESGT